MTIQAFVLAVIVVSSGILAVVSLKILSIVRQNPRPVGISRKSHQRRLRLLPEYRRMLPVLRITLTLMGAALLVDVLTSPRIPFLDWTVAAMSLIAIIGVWIVDRRPPGEAETQPR